MGRGYQGRRLGRFRRPRPPLRVVNEIVAQPVPELYAETIGRQRTEMPFSRRCKLFEVEAFGHDTRRVPRHIHRTGGKRGRIEAAAHGDADPAGRQAVGNRFRHQIDEAFGVLATVAIVEGIPDFQSPVSAHRRTASGNRQRMRRRQPPDVTIDRSLGLERITDGQEIGDPGIVQVARNAGLCGDPVQ